MNMVAILHWGLILLTAASTLYVVKDCWDHREELKTKDHWIVLGIIGFVTNFFDTWGIGSFAPTQASFKFTKSSSDKTVPGTLNIGDTLPVSVEAILFIRSVEIEPLTLFLMIGAAMAGAFLASGIVSKWDIKKVRIVLGAMLILVAAITMCRNAGIGPFGIMGTDIGLHGSKLAIGVAVNFVLGALMMVGCGLYSPCVALCAMLGMNIDVAFPIMMGSCAFLMNISVFKFVKEGAYDRKATLMLMFPGVVGAYVAYLLIEYAFSLTTLTYILCIVMLITAAMYFKDAKKGLTE